MHTLKLKIDDSVLDKFMELINKLPKDKVTLLNNPSDNSVSMAEAKNKVQKALEDISKNKGIDLDEALKKVLNS